MSTVLRRGLDAALQLQGTESGCAFEVDDSTGALELVAQRGVAQSDIGDLSPGTVGPTTTVKKYGSWLNLTLPVAYRGRPLAALVLRLPGDAPSRPGSWARLEALASIIALAVARLRADRLRGDSGANTETILDHMAEPVFLVDHDGMITAWNRACERVLGWSESEVIGRTVPCAQLAEEPGAFVSAVRNSAQSGSASFTFRCQIKEAPCTELHFTAAPLRDAIGDGTAYAVFTQRQSLCSRNEERDQMQLGIEARILAWIERCGLASFSQSECYQALRRRRGVTSPEDIVSALESLVASGRISKHVSSMGPRTGRPRSPIFLVEPADPDSAETG